MKEFLRRCRKGLSLIWSAADDLYNTRGALMSIVSIGAALGIVYLIGATDNGYAQLIAGVLAIVCDAVYRWRASERPLVSSGWRRDMSSTCRVCGYSVVSSLWAGVSSFSWPSEKKTCPGIRPPPREGRSSWVSSVWRRSGWDFTGAAPSRTILRLGATDFLDERTFFHAIFVQRGLGVLTLPAPQSQPFGSARVAGWRRERFATRPHADHSRRLAIG